MKIRTVTSTKKTTTFGDLNNGDVFRHPTGHGALYIKANTSHGPWAVLLSTGEGYSRCNNAPVVKVDGEFVEKE